MKKFVWLALLFLALPLAAQTTRNDDSCDIAQYPAATLLVPYFEVFLNQPATVAQTTLFTVVNTSRQPQIANVTVWTDLGFPVLNFPIFLTGYDAQAFNMYDILARGVIASTSSSTTPGSRSSATNPNFRASATADCTIAGGTLPASLLAEVRDALVTGRQQTACGTPAIGKVGSYHDNGAAIGSITIDVSATCSLISPKDPAYYDTLLYDNVLTGDYQIISPNAATGNFAGGNPLVHIRAIPAGGPAGSATATNLPYTFYDVFTPSTRRGTDRRQPLPSTFAARYIQGGTGAMNTTVQFWRESKGHLPLDGQCVEYERNIAHSIGVVRFDERENPTAIGSGGFDPPPPPQIPLVARYSSSSGIVFPALISGDVAGWFYLNLNNGGSDTYSSTRNLGGGSTTTGVRPSQGWVTTTMFAEGRYSVEQNATILGNGCGASPASTDPVGPASNVTP